MVPNSRPFVEPFTRSAGVTFAYKSFTIHNCPISLEQSIITQKWTVWCIRRKVSSRIRARTFRSRQSNEVHSVCRFSCNRGIGSNVEVFEVRWTCFPFVLQALSYLYWLINCVVYAMTRSLKDRRWCDHRSCLPIYSRATICRLSDSSSDAIYERIWIGP
jgi:hypothetical protein